MLLLEQGVPKVKNEERRAKSEEEKRRTGEKKTGTGERQKNGRGSRGRGGWFQAPGSILRDQTS